MIPLHLLPDEAYIHALQSMEIYDQLAYSLCSKNTKDAIKLLNLKAEAICICVNQKIGFDFYLENSIDFESSIAHDKHFSNEGFKLPNCIEVSVTRSSQTVSEWKMESHNFGAKDWLHHFCDVFHNHRIDELYFKEDIQINNDFIEPFQKVIDGLHIVSFSLSEHLTPEFTKKALETFRNYEKLSLGQVPYNSHEVHKIDRLLVQNLSKLYIRGSERLQIGQVLLSNCERLSLRRSMFTDKHINVFLKLWICGSNPRLKHFSAWKESPPGQRLPFNEEMIFKGIKHTKIPLDCQEEYREKIGKSAWNIMGLAGGSRIWRYDGTTAVVLIGWFGFEFIVGI